MPDLTPDDVARREFRSGFRGYDPSEVRAFLQEVGSALAALVEDRDAIAARLAKFDGKDLQTEIAAISREVGEVLEAARTAAETMRERAAADATRWRSEAVAEAEAQREAAAIDAERLRADAWTTSEQLLNQCQAHAAKVIEAAEHEALRLVGEAERESHRMQAAARREGDDLMRATRMEAERLSAEAKARHDEMIEAAMKQSEAAQERTLALEQRRQELLRELESVRATLVQVEGELDQRRERLGLSPPEEPPPAAAKVVTAAPRPTPPEPARPKEEVTTPGWVPGETVRVVRPERSTEESVARPVAQALEPEVKVLSGRQFARIKAGLDPDEEVEEAAEPAPVSGDEVDDSSFAPGHQGHEEASATIEEPAAGEEPEGPTIVPAADEAAEPVEEFDGTVGEVPPASDSRVPDDAGLDEVSGEPLVVRIDEMLEEEQAPEGPAQGPDAVVDISGVQESARHAMPTTDSDQERSVGAPADRSGEAQRLQAAPRIVSMPTEEAAVPEGQGALFNEVSGLFDRLRTGDVPDSRAGPSGPPPVAVDESAAERRLMSSMLDPFEIRDRLLLPIGNRALRNLKRQLTEAQNEALEEIRLDEAHWEPTADAIRARVNADLVVLHAEAFGAGHSAAEELVGGRVSRPTTPREEIAPDFVDDLVEELAHVLAEGRHSGHGARQLGASLSRVFRGWRTDQAERRVRDLSLRAYHEGLARSLELADVDELGWKVAGRGCASCRAAGAETVGDRLPPLHPGCECTVGP